MQFALPLPGEHGFLYYTGTARDRRSPLCERDRKAHARRSAQVLPKMRGALRSGVAVGRNGDASRRGGREFPRSYPSQSERQESQREERNDKKRRWPRESPAG